MKRMEISGDFHDVGLSIPRGRAGGVPHREVAHKPPASHSQCSWGLPHQSEQSPVEAGNLPAEEWQNRETEQKTLS